MPTNVEIEIENRMAEYDRISSALDGFVSKNALSDDTGFSLQLVAEEIVTNIIKYAFKDKAAHIIKFEVAIEGKTVHLRFSDDGAEFNPFNAPAPDISLPIEKRPVGGLGLHLVRSLCETVRYSRQDGRSIIDLHLKIKRRI